MAPKRTRRPNGDGSITPRETKTKGTVYDVQLSLKDRDTGITHRVTKRGFTTQKAAMDWRSRKMREASLKLYTRPRNVMLPDVVRQYIDENTDIVASTRKSYESALRNHITPDFNVRAEAVTARTLKAFVARSPSPQARTAALRVIKASLQWASMPDVGLIPTYPIAGRVRAPQSRKRLDIPRGDLALIFAASSEASRLIWEVMLHTGVRPGEAVGLNWADIDYSKAQLKVASIVAPESGERVSRTKGKHAHFVPINAALLRRLQAEQLRRGAKPSDPVFLARRGGRMSLRGLSREWELDTAAAGITGRTPHELRHTFATRALEAGISVPTVSKWLGHSSPAITLTHYAHVVAETEASAIETVRASLDLIATEPTASKTASGDVVTPLFPRDSGG